jgi:putative spermidine/putrescine transport system substrate-binding protein
MRIRCALLIVLGALLAGAVVGCGSGSSGDTGGTGAGETVTLGYVSYGGAYQEAQTKAWLDPFQNANPNIKIAQYEPTDVAKIEAMVESGNVTWDVCDVGNSFGIQDAQKLLIPLDPKVVPLDELQPDTLPTTGYRAPCLLYSVVVAYRTDRSSGSRPRGFADFFDLKEFPGKRGCLSAAYGGLLEMALIADGVPAAELYPLDVPRALKKIDTIRSSIIWWDTGHEGSHLLADDKVAMAQLWNGRVYDIAERGAPVAISWDQHILTADYLVIPKGSENPDAAMKLIGWITSAQNSAQLSYYIPYAPSNVGAFNQVDPAMAEWLPTSHPGGAIGYDDQWWSAHADRVNKAWKIWMER